MTIVVGIICLFVGGFLGMLLSALCVMAAPRASEQVRDAMQEAAECQIKLSTLRARIRTALMFLLDNEQVGDAVHVLEQAIGEGE